MTDLLHTLRTADPGSDELLDAVERLLDMGHGAAVDAELAERAMRESAGEDHDVPEARWTRGWAGLQVHAFPARRGYSQTKTDKLFHGQGNCHDL